MSTCCFLADILPKAIAAFRTDNVDTPTTSTETYSFYHSNYYLKIIKYTLNSLSVVPTIMFDIYLLLMGRRYVQILKEAIDISVTKTMAMFISVAVYSIISYLLLMYEQVASLNALVTRQEWGFAYLCEVSQAISFFLNFQPMVYGWLMLIIVNFMAD